MSLHPFNFTPTADEEVDHYVESHILEIVRAGSGSSVGNVGIQRNPNAPPGTIRFIVWNPSEVVKRKV